MVRWKMHLSIYTRVEADNAIIDPVNSECLFSVLDSLPLAIAHTGAYLQESGIRVETYLEFYEQQ